MSQTEILSKIHEDLELLKKDMAEIKHVIRLEPQLREEIKLQVREARERMSRGKRVSNKDILKEFNLE
ncbi:MAG: hypothetical protein AABX64_03180 [Nanoarchaeota archaeon]